MKLLPRLLTVLCLAVGLFGQEAAAGTVSKSQRELLVCITLSEDFTGPSAAFYDFVEFAAKEKVLSSLGTRYGKIHVLEKGNATLKKFVDKLDDVTAQSHVRAVDVIFVTHGLGGALYFSDKSVSAWSVRKMIKVNLNTAQRNKLRALFSTACYGSQHIAAWLSAGFKVVSGSKLIYADSAFSFQPFLDSWKYNNTFQTAVTKANLSDPFHIQDAIAKQVLKAAGYDNWNEVNSQRIIGGDSSIRITTAP